MNDLDLKIIPKHIAIIMDGNRRWARDKGLSAVAGHDFVADRVLEPLVDKAVELGIEYMTFWAFSTENWMRNKREVEGMMRIFRKGLKKSAKRMHEKGVKIRILGDIDKFPEDITRQSREWVEMSKNNQRITVSFALNYGGRDEILRAFKKLLNKFSNNQFSISKLTTDSFSQFIDTKGMPDPDMIIRTGGEKRLSGFMLWQCAYSELFFTDTLMPDFKPEDLERAVEEYGRRSRRFGR